MTIKTSYIIYIFLILFFCFPIYTFPSEPSKETGKSVYAKNCWFCHGQKGDGNSDAAAVLKPKPKNFTDPEVKKDLTFDKMVYSITNGLTNTAMPSFKETISPDEIISVAKYIKETIMNNLVKDKLYVPHADGFSYIDFNKINKNSDIKICLLQCHTDETFIRSRLKAFK